MTTLLAVAVVTCLILAIVVAVMALAIPYICWRSYKGDSRLDAVEVKIASMSDQLSSRLTKLEGDLESLDEVLDRLLRVTGLPTEDVKEDKSMMTNNERRQ